MNIELTDLLEAGVHFGHQVKRWNPKSKSFVFDHRQGISIIDLSKSYDGLKKAYDFLEEAVANGADQTLSAVERSFLYMPYMHSESAGIHTVALQLFDQAGLENNLDFEKRHKAIIDRFGRYPHRNALLGRPSTPEEIEFLQQPGSSF